MGTTTTRLGLYKPADGETGYGANVRASLDTIDLGCPTIYQEGTWTPSVGGNATYTSATGLYTRIGNLVTITCFLAINTIGTGNSSVISGLPFTTKINSQFTAICQFNAGAVNAYHVYVQSAGGSTSLNIQGTNALGAGIVALGLLGNGTSLAFSGTYMV